MSIHDDYLAALTEMFGGTPPDRVEVQSAPCTITAASGTPPDRVGVQPAPFATTAAVISKPRLLITTVKFGAASTVTVEEHRSGLFELGGRDTEAVRALSCELAEFFRSRRIRHLHLRVSADAGRFSADAHAMKIETVLQLVPRLRVTLHSTQSVSAWIRREDPPLPLVAPLGLGPRWENVRDSALETAFFVRNQGLNAGGARAHD